MYYGGRGDFQYWKGQLLWMFWADFQRLTVTRYLGNVGMRQPSLHLACLISYFLQTLELTIHR